MQVQVHAQEQVTDLFSLLPPAPSSALLGLVLGMSDLGQEQVQEQVQVQV